MAPDNDKAEAEGNALARVSAHPRKPAYDAKLQAALLTCSTVKEAAEQAGIHYATARRRLADPDFRAEREEWSRRILAEGALDLLGLTAEAIATCRELLADAATPAATRRLLIRDALEFALRFAETSGLAEAVAELQEAVGIDPRTQQQRAAA